jgi:YtkA-like
MAPEALPRRVRAALVTGWCLALACSSPAARVTATWKVNPTPAVTGAATVVRVTLQSELGPVRGANLRLEAHMSHPGMTALEAEMIESSAGTYEASLQLSMAGEWVLVVSGKLADGGWITQHMKIMAGPPSG